MKNERSFPGICLPLLIIALLFSLQTVSAQVQWRRVSQAELEMKTPKVEADADAEAIFWEVRLDDEKRKKMFYSHYVRVKIFTERGRERFSKFDIPFTKGRMVEDVAARVIKPDTTIIEVEPGDIFEREILKAGKVTVKAKSFAVPGIEPGAIVEYQYKETLKNDSAENERLYFQRDIPVQRITYYVRPYKYSRLSFSFQNMPPVQFVPDSDGFYVGTRENVTAFKEEPQMPPADEVKQWALLSYNRSSFSWSAVGNQFGLYFDEQTKPSSEINQKASELIAGLLNDEERLRRLFDFAQKQIKNVTFDLGMSDEQRESVKNKKPSDTLSRRIGSSRDIDFLFAALARAAGFEVKLMLSGDRSENFFNPNNDTGLSYIHPSGIAVKNQQGWKFCSPGTPFLPFGIIDWYEEGVYSLLTNGQSYGWINSAVSKYSQNLSHRTGKFKLLEDGTLEGFVRVEHNGHQATSRRRDLFAKTVNEREELLKKSWKTTIATAEISDFSFENFDEGAKPYTYSFKVRIPNYAQKTGKRLFLQPGFFEYGTNPLFSGETRKYPIYFEYPWSEEDEIEIELPKNFEADSVASPDAVREASGIGAVTIKIELGTDTNILKYKREFFFGNGKILFPPTAYKPLKVLFDSFHKADTHLISLKQKQ
jgi:transglutaminase-like putative cysteine protease